MRNYEYKDNNAGGKILLINNDNSIIAMNMHQEVEGHTALMQFLENESNLIKYVEYLFSDPDRPFNIDEILNL